MPIYAVAHLYTVVHQGIDLYRQFEYARKINFLRKAMKIDNNT
ncbi:MAG: hypothetical protein CSYNP_00998 [Syntrophus sp. SKADARSKE-3]|nr:hypothetical protein [Syntrophus sp. SKADARSKE-3]